MTEPLLHSSTKLQANAVLGSEHLNAIGIFGPPGSGKTYLLRYILSTIFDTDSPATQPYIKYIDCKEKVGISEIREIKSFLQLKVPGSKKISRAVVVESIELLSEAAQNTVLKMFEEPPTGTIILTTASNKNKVLPTISSRLQWIHIHPLSKSLLTSNFASIDQNILEKAYNLSGGRVGLLKKIIDGNDEIDSLNASIAEAKIILRLSKFERLAKVDELIKNEQFSLEELLDAMIKIMHVIIKKSIHTDQPLQAVIKKINLLVEARESLRYKPSSKLLLTKLFNSL